MTKAFTYNGLSSQQCQRFQLFAQLIQQQSRIHNLTAITETEAIYIRHFADSLAALAILDVGARQKTLIDIGSGAGLPGLALAIALPDWQITSLEATGKKLRFQQMVIDELRLTNARVIPGRAETLALDPAYRQAFDVVTARAIADMAILAELAIPLVKVKGKVLAWKGKSCAAELTAANNAIKTLGGRVGRKHNYTLDDKSQMVIIVLDKIAGTQKKYPREFKAIKSSPLGK